MQLSINFIIGKCWETPICRDSGLPILFYKIIITDLFKFIEVNLNYKNYYYQHDKVRLRLWEPSYAERGYKDELDSNCLVLVQDKFLC